MKLHTYAPVFKLPALGQAVEAPAGMVFTSPSRIVTFTNALDIHSLLPAVRLADQIGSKFKI